MCTRYVRAGIVVTDLRKKGSQPMLDAFESPSARRDLAAALATVSDRFGPTALGLGRAGMQTPAGWEMKRRMMSRRATTVWDERPAAKAG